MKKLYETLYETLHAEMYGYNRQDAQSKIGNNDEKEKNYNKI